MLKAKNKSVQGLAKVLNALQTEQSRLYQENHSLHITNHDFCATQWIEGGESTVEVKTIIIATGSDVTPYPGGAIEIDEEQNRCALPPEGTRKDGHYQQWCYWTGDGQCMGPSGFRSCRRQVSE